MITKRDVIEHLELLQHQVYRPLTPLQYEMITIPITVHNMRRLLIATLKAIAQHQ